MLLNPPAVQTILWGERPSDLTKMLETISDLGFKGVEFFQVPAFLGTNEPSLQELSTSFGQPEVVDALLSKYGLRLLGLAGGSLARRIEFCRRLSDDNQPLYLYVEYWDDSDPGFNQLQRTKPKYKLALHPHLFKGPTRLSEIVKTLDAHPELLLIPDTAHLHLAGVDMAQLLDKYSSRIVALHLKDWTHLYGWSRVDYARGFVELGQGELKPLLEEVMKWASDHPNVWVVSEQDFTHYTPEESLANSASWLGVTPVKRSSPANRKSALLDFRHSSLRSTEAMPEQILSQALKGPIHLYPALCEAAARYFSGKWCSLWEVNHRIQSMHLQSFWGYGRSTPGVRELALSDALSGMAVRERIPVITERLRDHAKYGRFNDLALIHEYNVDVMLSFPLANLFNPNANDIVLNVLFERSNEQLTLHNVQVFTRFANVALEHAWTQSRLKALQNLYFEATKAPRLTSLLQRYAEIIKKELRCDGVSIFLLSSDHSKMVLKCTTGLEDSRPHACIEYSRHDGSPCAEVWVKQEEINLPDASKLAAEEAARLSLSCTWPWERLGGQSKAILISPIHKLGQHAEVIGLIRCSGKMPSSAFQAPYFNLTDEIVLDAIECGISPHIEQAVAETDRASSFRLIRHELKHSLGNIRTTVDRAKQLLDPNFLDKAYGPNPYDLFDEQPRRQPAISEPRLSHDLSLFLNDILRYASSMDSVMLRKNYLTPFNPDELVLTYVQLGEHCIGPQMHQLESSSEVQRFEKTVLTYASTLDLPRMRLDLSLFNVVVANLLSNALKYACVGAKVLDIKVRGVDEKTKGCVLHFEDQGIGITPGMEEAIFRLGFREERAKKLQNFGDGIGLWYVREIVEAHKGTVKVTSCSNPTRFTIWLPPGLQTIGEAKTTKPK